MKIWRTGLNLLKRQINNWLNTSIHLSGLSDATKDKYLSQGYSLTKEGNLKLNSQIEIGVAGCWLMYNPPGLG